MHYPKSMQPTHARWEQIDDYAVKAEAEATVNPSTESRKTDSHVDADEAPVPSIFTPVHPVYSRNYRIVDIGYETAPSHLHGLPGTYSNASDLGFNGLASVPDDIKAELPPECLAAFEESLAREQAWKGRFSSEGADGCRKMPVIDKGLFMYNPDPAPPYYTHTNLSKARDDTTLDSTTHTYPSPPPYPQTLPPDPQYHPPPPPLKPILPIRPLKRGRGRPSKAQLAQERERELALLGMTDRDAIIYNIPPRHQTVQVPPPNLAISRIFDPARYLQDEESSPEPSLLMPARPQHNEQQLRGDDLIDPDLLLHDFKLRQQQTQCENMPWEGTYCSYKTPYH